MSLDIDPVEMISYMRYLWELEEAGERAPIIVGPFSAITLIGVLQLGLRHPELTEQQKRIISHLIDQFRPFFAGTYGEKIIRMGDNPEYYQPLTDKP